MHSQSFEAALPETPAPTDPRRRDVQVGLVFAGIVFGAISVLAISLLFPAAGDNNFFTYDSVSADRDFHWSFLTFVAANIVVSAISVGLASVMLVPARGWPWATAGFTLGVIGAALYAIGVGGWAMTYFFATDPTALDASTATALVDSVNDDSVRLFTAAFSGAISIAIATLLMAIGLWRSRNLPKWVIGLSVVGAVLPLVVPVEGIVGALVESPAAIAAVLIGWQAWRLRHALR
jgi:hypothetical protein